VKLSPGTANDEVTGKVSIDGGSVSVTTRDLGTVRVPYAAFKCRAHRERTGYALAVWVEGEKLPAVNKLAPNPSDLPGEMTAYRGALYDHPDLTFYPFNQ
jgi:hypothetical protein